MKKAAYRNGAPAVKKRAIPKDIDEYLARVPEPARTTLQKSAPQFDPPPS